MSILLKPPLEYITLEEILTEILIEMNILVLLCELSL
jgi:hypothetical protein